MQINSTDCSANRANISMYSTLFLAILFVLTVSVSGSYAADPWSVRIDASKENFIEAHSFDEVQKGFTYVVPPDIVRQTYNAEQTASGYLWTLQGVELSAWQTLPTPPGARYMLNWHFEYEGEILEGGGRTGFIFGNPDNANLMSVEVTRAGSLRLLMWGNDPRGRVGRIIWSKETKIKRNSPVRIEADYDMREGTITCRVNGGDPVRIKLSDYTPSGPMTIKAVGFFAAVQEARIATGTLNRSRPPEYEIDLSSKNTKVEHRRLDVNGS